MTILFPTLWIALTLTHGVLTTMAANRLLPSDRSLDARVFHATLIGVGSLLCLIHGTALTLGLTRMSGLVVMGFWQGVLVAVVRRGGQRDTPAPAGLPEMAAVGVTVALLGHWAAFALGSWAVTGTDAAQYHVPNAVNLSLGTNLFGLPATQHLYPVAGSAAAAWFLLPTQTALTVDLAMCLPFLLLGAAVNLIVRRTTGLSGLAWSSWLVLLLFATPLFRSASLVSADLWFAAGFLALVAAGLDPWASRAWHPRDVLLVALAAGIVVGSKATGIVAAVLLTVLTAIASAWWRPRWAGPRRMGATVALAAVACVVCLSAGGIWLVRNWLLFGSPLAPNGVSVLGITLFPGDPLQPTTYLSVLGDMQETPGYPLAARAAHYVRLWLGRWYLPLLVPAVLVPLDLVLSTGRAPSERRAARAFLLGTTVLAGGLLTWMLVGAPWTSLEWTRGLALRYALPVLTLAPLLAFVGLFPLRWPWQADRNARDGMALAWIGSTLLIFVTGAAVSGPRAGPVPLLTPGGLGLGAAVVAAWLVVRRTGRGVVLLPIAGVVIASFGGAPVVARQDAAAVGEREALEAAEWSALEAGQAPLSEAREVALRLRETVWHAWPCARHRLFSLTRLDEPLTFEGPVFDTAVFYAGWDVALTGRYGPLGPCDAVLTSPALRETTKGAALEAALAGPSGLREVARSARFIVLAAR